MNIQKRINITILSLMSSTVNCVIQVENGDSSEIYKYDRFIKEIFLPYYLNRASVDFSWNIANPQPKQSYANSNDVTLYQLIEKIYENYPMINKHIDIISDGNLGQDFDLDILKSINAEDEIHFYFIGPGLKDHETFATIEAILGSRCESTEFTNWNISNVCRDQSKHLNKIIQIPYDNGLPGAIESILHYFQDEYHVNDRLVKCVDSFIRKESYIFPKEGILMGKLFNYQSFYDLIKKLEEPLFLDIRILLAGLNFLVNYKELPNDITTQLGNE